MLAAMLARPTLTAMPRISAATSTRMATCTAPIILIIRPAMCMLMAMLSAPSSLPPVSYNLISIFALAKIL